MRGPPPIFVTVPQISVGQCAAFAREVAYCVGNGASMGVIPKPVASMKKLPLILNVAINGKKKGYRRFLCLFLSRTMCLHVEGIVKLFSR